MQPLPSQLCVIVLYSLVLLWLPYSASVCPSQCECVNLVYVYCDNRTIEERDFENLVSNIPANARYLDLSHNHLTVVPKRLFQQLPNLLQLNLAYNSIAEITSGSLDGLSHLSKLDLHANRLSRVRRGALTHLSNLQELHLENNGITLIAENALNNLVNLQVLHLQENRLDNIRPGMFTKLQTMEKLDLSKNGIEILQNDAFLGLDNLQYLFLQDNGIIEVKGDMFTGLPRLQELHIDHNGIAHLGEQSLPIGSLRVLSINNNKITNLSEETFKYLGGLEKLSINYNMIQKLKSGSFSGLTRLRELSLAGNKMQDLSRNTFRGVRLLSLLDLHGNAISRISTGTFDNFRDSVYILDLSRNSLRSLKQGMFRKMTVLQNLNIADNKIRHIEPGALKDLDNLLELNLENNDITVITNAMINGLTSLQVLYLHRNPIVKFSGVKFDTSSVVYVSLNLTVFNITDQSASIRWPYSSGDYIYWSMYISCVGVKDCEFGPQPEYLPAYKTEEKITNLKPSSVYYVCIKPTFVFSTAVIDQCGFINTRTPNDSTEQLKSDHVHGDGGVSIATRTQTQMLGFVLTLFLVLLG